MPNYCVCRCVYQHPDPTGKVGVELSRDLVKVAAKALTHNLTKLGPKVLPWSEKLLFAANWVGRKVLPGRLEYVPDFKEAFDHFCLHAGRNHKLLVLCDDRSLKCMILRDGAAYQAFFVTIVQ